MCSRIEKIEPFLKIAGAAGSNQKGREKEGKGRGVLPEGGWGGGGLGIFWVGMCCRGVQIGTPF